MLQRLWNLALCKTLVLLFVNSCEIKQKPQWLTEQFQWKLVLVKSARIAILRKIDDEDDVVPTNFLFEKLEKKLNTYHFGIRR